jgi:hypothetical protein
MFVQSLVHVPETVTGLLGAFIIGLSLVSSIRFNRRQVDPMSEFRFAEGEDE